LSIGAALARERDAELLRFMTCGAVDHGKSTIVGRLLYDSSSVPEDTVDAARRATARYTPSLDLDFAFLVDGLRAEREQGITIDAAFRYFSTRKRKFILADVPGHQQYTRNMATAAAVSDLALLIVDIREGVVEQTRRHAFIAALFGIKHIVVAANKMDTVAWSEEAFNAVRDAFRDFAARLEVVDVEFIPVAAATGDNVVTASSAMPWYSGRPLLDYLENVHIAGDRNLIDLRLPVQLVLRTDSARYAAGSLASGILRPGDTVALLPSRERARVTTILHGEERIEEAFPPMAIAVALDRTLDVSRGDVLAHVHNLPDFDREFEAMLVWTGSEPLDTAREYLLKLASVTTPAAVRQLRYAIDVNDLRRYAAGALHTNEVGRVRIQTTQPVAFDPYDRNRVMGAFILIDRLTNETAGAGMIVDREAGEVERSGRGRVTEVERLGRARHSPFIVSVASEEAAFALERRLFDAGYSPLVVGPDEVAGVSALTRAGVIPIVVGRPAGLAGSIRILEGEDAVAAAFSAQTHSAS
jgi:sulfate adenylyltransferase large subunit